MIDNTKIIVLTRVMNDEVVTLQSRRLHFADNHPEVPKSESFPRFSVQKSPESGQKVEGDRVGQAQIVELYYFIFGREPRHDCIRCRFPASIADECWPLLLRYVSEVADFQS